MYDGTVRGRNVRHGRHHWPCPAWYDSNRFSNTEAMNGEASLWMEEFRGETVASMVYDGKPVHDHFKVVDDNAVLGIMNGKGAMDTSSGTPRHLYFYLERV